MNILKNTQICKILHEIYLRKNCLKFKSIWASYILSDEPTDGQMQKQNKTKTPKNPPRWGQIPCHQWVTQRQKTKKTLTTNQRATTLVIHTDRHHSKKLHNSKCCCREHTTFPQSWLFKFLRPCQSKYLFSIVGIKDKYYYHKDKMSLKYWEGAEAGITHTHEEYSVQWTRLLYSMVAQFYTTSFKNFSSFLCFAVVFSSFTSCTLGEVRGYCYQMSANKGHSGPREKERQTKEGEKTRRDGGRVRSYEVYSRKEAGRMKGENQLQGVSVRELREKYKTGHIRAILDLTEDIKSSASYRCKFHGSQYILQIVLLRKHTPIKHTCQV